MKKLLISIMILLFSASADAGTIIDHRHTNLDINLEKVHAAANSVKWLYIRLSHGRQLNVGLGRIEDSDFAVCMTYLYLCEEDEALCSSNGLTEPYAFWKLGGADIVRAKLDADPRFNLFMFCWCTHLNAYTTADVDVYLSEMEQLEQEYPDVTFVYATGTAEEQGSYGFNRYMRNLQIRDYCTVHGKALYDFADIESWYAGNQATYLYDGIQVPYLHPELYGNDAEHASYLNCEYKGMAFWNLAVQDVVITGNDHVPAATGLGEIYPNPFNPSTTISFSLDARMRVALRIYDVSGRLARELLNEDREAGAHREHWDGRDSSGREAASGMYFCCFDAGNLHQTKKIVLIR